MKKIILIIILAGILACNSNDEIILNENNFLIFGHFYGECFGEGCIETYKLTDKKLFEDTNNKYSGTDFNFIELDDNTFEGVKDIIDFFPNQLLNSNKSTFGCPDCADGGGLFIQYSENGNVKSWRIDQTKVDVPAYLHNFIDKVNEKIHFINN